MKVLIIGGHFTPALAVIDALSEKDQVVFVGRASSFEGSSEKSLEYQEILRRKIKFYPLSTGRIQRHFSRKFVPSLFKLPKGFAQAVSILREEKPDVVVGFGGYLSFPVGYAAFFLRIPIVIHEQTFGAGLANKSLSRIAKKICISWDSSRQFFSKDKTVLTGNPLPKRSHQKDTTFFRDAQKNLPLLLVTGGSSGSHAINVLIESSLPVLLQGWKIFHQTGDASQYQDFDRLVRYKKSLDFSLSRNYEVVKFVDTEKMESLMEESKIVIGRSGINTVSQVMNLGKPALFIPLPIGQKGEQLTNAQAVERVGLAKVLLQKDATSERIIEILDEMIKSYDALLKKGELTREMINPHSAKNIVKEIEYVVKEKTS